MVQKPQRNRLARNINIPVLKTVPVKESNTMPTFRENPYPMFNFLVNIDGTGGSGEIVGGFMECFGLESVTEVIEYRMGNEKFNSPRKLPGLTKFSNIILKRGFIGAMDLYDWRQTVIDGQVAKKNFSITLLDESRSVVCKWDIRNAWPCRLSGPKLVAGQSGVAIEEIEICHEGYTVSNK
jgi:phage tail-like protein